MEEGNLEISQKPGKWGAPAGSNNGGGRRPSIEKIRAEIYDISKAEFWCKLANDKAVVRLEKMLDNPDDAVAFKAIKEILDRTLGKPRESIDHTTKGESMNTVISVNYLTPSDDPDAEANT